MTELDLSKGRDSAVELCAECGNSHRDDLENRTQSELRKKGLLGVLLPLINV